MKTRQYALVLLMALSVVAVAWFPLAATASVGTDEPAPSASVAEDYALIVLANDPIARYEGDIEGYPATKPAPGEKIDFHSDAVRKYSRFLADKRTEYRSWLKAHAPDVDVLRQYEIVLQGLAVKLNGVALDVLAQGPGVDVVVHSWLYRPAMNASVDVIKASDVWPSVGGRENAGSGIKVGVIDSGIDDTHRFFACKDDIPHKVYASGVAFDPTNLLVFDHGTHVAGTIAGCVIELDDPELDTVITGTISGVAPAAELWDYNVFPGFGAGFVAFGGSAFSHDIIAALEDTVRDGMDVINMSLGGGVSGPRDILSEAVDATVDAGIVAAVAAGNSGPGDQTVASPGNAPGALTAGASTNAHFIGVPITVTEEDGDKATYFGVAGDFDPYEENPAFDEPLADWKDTGDETGEACEEAEDASAVDGTIAVIKRGSCTFTTKIRNAQNAGAIGVIVYNNVEGTVAMAHDGTEPKPTIPAVSVTRDAGLAILASLPATATIPGPEELPAEPDVLAGFSSRGPTPFTYLIKPDATAPGVNVYSSIFDDEFAMFAGTSMATPHMAGSSAVLLQQNPGWSPADVKSALVNTADRAVTEDGEDPGVLHRGGGRINLLRAEATPATLVPASVSFGLFTGNVDVEGSVDVTFTSQTSNLRCKLSVEVDVGGQFEVTLSDKRVHLQGDGAQATVTVTLDGGRQVESGDYEGDIVADCGTETLRSPWWFRVERTSGDSQGIQSLETVALAPATLQTIAALAAVAVGVSLAVAIRGRRRD